MPITWMSYAEAGLPPGAMPHATSFCWSHDVTGAIADCDVIIWNEPAHQSDFTAHVEDGLVDLKQILLHEWGHSMGPTTPRWVAP